MIEVIHVNNPFWPNIFSARTLRVKTGCTLWKEKIFTLKAIVRTNCFGWGTDSSIHPPFFLANCILRTYSVLVLFLQPNTVCDCVWKDSVETGAERALEGGNEYHGEADCAASSYRPYGKTFSPSWLIAESVAIACVTHLFDLMSHLSR